MKSKHPTECTATACFLSRVLNPRLILAWLFLPPPACTDGRSYPPTHPVNGEVLLNGKPVSDAIISFAPQAAGMPSATGFVKDGKITDLKTADLIGVVEGEHVVTIMDDMMKPGAVNHVPDKYSAMEGGIKVTVKNGEVNNFKFELESTANDAKQKAFVP